MPDCRELTRLLSAAQDESSPMGVRTSVRLHLMICRGCRNVDDQMRFMRKAIRLLQLELPDESSAATTMR